MKIKNILLLATSSILIIAIVVGTVFYGNISQTAKALQNDLDSVKATEESTEVALLDDYSTADEVENATTAEEYEIARLEHEIAFYEGANSGETEQTVKQVAVDYVNCRYNYDGTLQENSERILKEIEQYVYESYMVRVEDSLSTTKSAGNGGASAENKKVDNYCTVDDVYYYVDEYSDTGEKLYMTVCALHNSDGKSITYRKINVTQTDDGYYVNDDEFLLTRGKDDYGEY